MVMQCFGGVQEARKMELRILIYTFLSELQYINGSKERNQSSYSVISFITWFILTQIGKI